MGDKIVCRKGGLFNATVILFDIRNYNFVYAVGENLLKFLTEKQNTDR